MSTIIHKKLSELSATAICGNDITSSCLYVSGLAIFYAGQYAWISLLMVSGILFLFRKIYAEAVGALPLNGGAYNILLNTSSKSNASMAACLTILSYMATAVISASEAMHYLHTIFASIPVFESIIALLAIFLLLAIMGISESAKAAVGIFIFHIISLSILFVSGIIYLIMHGSDILSANFSLPLNGSISAALFFGFSAAMLGISGFESSANFVEEQQKGVFPKTLRNMWIAVTVINPVIAILAIAVLQISVIGEHKESLLSYLGNQTGGGWLSVLISVDAFLVLSGAVLTSFVGVTGLIKRMTLDRILPQFLLKENSKGSSPRIPIIFFILCISILFITNAQLEKLAGVYTISFLLVMGYFAFGNLLLKIKRSRLPRPVIASPLSVILAFSGIIIAIYGNIKLHPEYLVIFLQYFIPAMVLIIALMNRNDIYFFLINLSKTIFDEFRKFSLVSQIKLKRHLRELHSQKFVFFSKGDNISILNKVMMYVQENEMTDSLKIVTILNKERKISDSFLSDIEVLDRMYPDIKVEYVTLVGKFTPEMVEKLSDEWKIPKNFMFISAPSAKFPFEVSEFGGVRLII
ncbi:MAG: APC family permease [Saprospiraceae bacterium]|nr:APC family permease [Saprospiraceae bacterium]